MMMRRLSLTAPVLTEAFLSTTVLAFLDGGGRVVFFLAAQLAFLGRSGGGRRRTVVGCLVIFIAACRWNLTLLA